MICHRDSPTLMLQLQSRLCLMHMESSEMLVLTSDKHLEMLFLGDSKKLRSA